MKDKTEFLRYILDLVIILIGAFISCLLLVIQTVGLAGISAYITTIIPVVLVLGNIFLVGSLVHKNKVVATVLMMSIATVLYYFSSFYFYPLLFDVVVAMHTEEMLGRTSIKWQDIFWHLRNGIIMSVYLAMIGSSTVYIYLKKKYIAKSSEDRFDWPFWLFCSLWYTPLLSIVLAIIMGTLFSYVGLIITCVFVVSLSSHLASHNKANAGILSFCGIAVLVVCMMRFSFTQLLYILPSLFSIIVITYIILYFRDVKIYKHKKR